MIEVDLRQVLHFMLAQVELDTGLHRRNGANGDRHLFAAPQVAFLEQYVSHVVAAGIDDKSADSPDVAVFGMDVLASAHSHLAQGQRIAHNGLLQVADSETRSACHPQGTRYSDPQAEVGPREHLSRAVVAVAGSSREELRFLRRVEFLEFRQSAAEVYLTAGRADELKGDEPAEPLAVLRLDDQVGDRAGDRIDDHLSHMPADPVGAACVGADRELCRVRHCHLPRLRSVWPHAWEGYRSSSLACWHLELRSDEASTRVQRPRGCVLQLSAPIANVPVPEKPDALAALLSASGFIAAEEEAAELLASASGDVKVLEALVNRRLAGEPLAWITGKASFCGLEIQVHQGVYVPRWQSEPLALRAVERLPASGIAIDLCTGAGAIAKTLAANRRRATVVASEVDELAFRCAVANGVDVYLGDLFAPFPQALERRVDVVVGVVPYVPTPELPLMPVDTFVFESPLSYDGGADGTEVLRRVLSESPRFLREGGALLLEVGGEQADAIGDDLARLGYVEVAVLSDEDGDVRGIEATLSAER